MRTCRARWLTRVQETILAGVLVVAVMAPRPAVAQLQCYTGPPPPNQEGPPEVKGFWEPIVDLGTEAIHAVHLPTGKVLVWNRASTVARTYDPETGVLTDTGSPISSFFCGGHAHLPDGRVLVAGGRGSAARSSSVFDPWAETWTIPVAMHGGRYYPTLTSLEDGRVFTASGIGTGGWYPEVYDPATDSWSRIGCNASGFFCSKQPERLHFFPRTAVGPDGTLFMTPASRTMWAYALDEDLVTWTRQPIGPADSGKMESAPATYYATGKFLRAGKDTYHRGKDAATTTATVIDFNNLANVIYRDVAPMAYARNRNTLTLLADGTVLTTGGDRNAPCQGGDTNVYNAELWDPGTETWTTLGAMQVRRVYHSTALLLRDGSVLSAGGDFDQTSQIFRPPYLFLGPRPTITTAPAVVTYGTTFTVDTPEAATITQVNLLHLGSVTHAYDQSQRFDRLSYTGGPGPNQLTVTAPLDGYEAPPGYHMLFLISDQGVPSIAEYVRVTP